MQLPPMCVDFCRAFDKVEGCLQRIRSHCGRVDEHWFLGIERSYNYVCDETFDGEPKYERPTHS